MSSEKSKEVEKKEEIPEYRTALLRQIYSRITKEKVNGNKMFLYQKYQKYIITDLHIIIAS